MFGNSWVDDADANVLKLGVFGVFVHEDAPNDGFVVAG